MNKIKLSDWFLAIIIVLLSIIASGVIAMAGKPQQVQVEVTSPAPAPRYFTTSDFDTSDEKSSDSNRNLEEWDEDRRLRREIRRANEDNE